MKVGLTETMQDPRCAVVDPTLSYVREPKPNSFSALQAERKQQNLTELKKLEKKIGTVKNAE